MGRFGYLFKRIVSMDKKEMRSRLRAISKKTGRSKLYILNDMRKCAVRYGAGYMDYDLYEMYDLTEEQRDTYITRGRNNDLVVRYNDPSMTYIFDNKIEFCERFNDFLRRDWIPVTAGNRDKVIEFIRKHDIFMVKPADGSCGKGIEKIRRGEYASEDELYSRIMGYGGKYYLDEFIDQHSSISEIYSGSINTVRVIAIRGRNGVHIICAYLRIGNAGRHVDNFNSGGMVAPVDEKTGIVKDKAIDKEKNVYIVHPSSGKEIMGFRIPFWDDITELVKKAGTVVPEVRYIGWDVAVTSNGPCLVEGNNFPGHDIYQLPGHVPDKTGIYKKFIIE